MTIEIMNREKALEYSFQKHDDRAAMISITNRECEIMKRHIPDSVVELPSVHNNPENRITAHCIVDFNDVGAGRPNCITDVEANTIAAFVKDVTGKNDKLIVHCEYGVSRSAGVAAAIMLFLTGDDWSVFKNVKYFPNMVCYRMVLEAFEMDIDEQELLEKKETNRNLADKESGLAF